jgi:hypothetical protein
LGFGTLLTNVCSSSKFFFTSFRDCCLHQIPTTRLITMQLITGSEMKRMLLQKVSMLGLHIFALLSSLIILPEFCYTAKDWTLKYAS